MEQLRKALERTATDHAAERANSPMILGAQEWATHSLATYNGELLRLALRISEAMAGFVSELEGPPDAD
jgi:hypothetical protein